MRRIADPTVRMSRRAGIVMGLGLGGLADGILFHQIMHGHNMGSSVLPPTSMQALGQNMVWDGLFHLIEGIVDHEILNLHHVRDLPIHIPILDWLFLIIGGLGFIALGAMLVRPTPQHAPAPAL